MKAKIIIDCSSQILYSSFYIKGLYEVFGKKNISFSSEYFKTLKRRNESHSFDHYMALIIITPNKKQKIIIDFRDKVSVKENAYKWCDKYAKVNFNKDLTDIRFHDKMISIPPGFGIKIWNFWETIYNCCFNLIKCRFSPLVSFNNYLKDYYRQFRCAKIDDYLIKSFNNENKDKSYVFMIGTLWLHKNCIENTNLARKKFVEYCKFNNNINFEGGFFAYQNHPQYDEFKELIFKKRYSLGSFIEKTRLSAIAFNTPAVHNCHGWKLGQYLAMGKAIISTPLSNQLPEELIHGKNIHIVSNEKEIEDGIELVLNDNNYKKLLENGAKLYYSKFVDPKNVINYIIQN